MIQPILTSCPDLISMFELLHKNEKVEVEYLTDLWLACATENDIAKHKAITQD